MIDMIHSGRKVGAPRKKRKAVNASQNGMQIHKIIEEINYNAKVRTEIMEAFEQEGRPLTRQALDQWRIRKLKKGYSKGVPADRVFTVARVMKLDPHKIRPDIFPKPRG